MFIRVYRNPKTIEIGSGKKLLLTFLSLRFFDMRRVRHNFFLCWLFHLTPTRCGPRPQTTGLASASSENRLSSSSVESQQTVFSNSPNRQPRFRAWRHSSSQSHFLSRVFTVISLIVTSPRARAQFVHLTCTKRKVLSLTKPKGKIYKTKFLRNYITRRRHFFSSVHVLYSFRKISSYPEIWPKTYAFFWIISKLTNQISDYVQSERSCWTISFWRILLDCFQKLGLLHQHFLQLEKLLFQSFWRNPLLLWLLLILREKYFHPIGQLLHFTVVSLPK